MAFLAVWSHPAAAAPKAELWEFWQKSDEANSESIDHQVWQKILNDYLYQMESGVNLFAYNLVLPEDRELLSSYLVAMQRLDPRTYSSGEQLAYWINLYNALTVQLILQNYPVESITKLGKGFFKFGPWDDPVATVAGQDLTLNDIEHRVLRPIWSDYRIHFVVNCASIGCPNLQPTAFTSANTDELMDLSAREYLMHSRAIQFHPEGRLTMSSLFDWYADDFGNSQTDILETLSAHLPQKLAEPLRGYNGPVKYDYDWGLNEYLGEVD